MFTKIISKGKWNQAGNFKLKRLHLGAINKKKVEILRITVWQQSSALPPHHTSFHQGLHCSEEFIANLCASENKCSIWILTVELYTQLTVEYCAEKYFFCHFFNPAFFTLVSGLCLKRSIHCPINRSTQHLFECQWVLCFKLPRKKTKHIEKQSKASLSDSFREVETLMNSEDIKNYPARNRRQINIFLP